MGDVVFGLVAMGFAFIALAALAASVGAADLATVLLVLGIVFAVGARWVR